MFSTESCRRTLFDIMTPFFFALTLLCSTASAAITQPIAKFDLTQLKILFTKHKPATLEAALALLPASLRKNVVFIQNSDSLQAGDKMNPRAILWSEHGGFAISFTGKPEVRGGTALEVMQFNPSEKKFHYVEVTFPFNPKTSVNEPQKCLQCHGTDARPIWQEYPVWGHSYGSYDDIMTGEQLTEYEKFLEYARTNERYKQALVDEKSKEWHTNFPFRPDTIIRATNIGTAFAYRPNLRFGAYLTRVNALRLARIIESHPDFEKKKETLLAALIACKGYDTREQLAKILSEFGLTNADIDLRFHYDEPKNKDLDTKISYFDGSATVLEYLAAQLLPKLKIKAELRGMSDKYAAQSPRNELDRPFFKLLDRVGLWFPTPYPKNELTKNVQKREPFHKYYTEEQQRVCSLLKPSAIAVEDSKNNSSTANTPDGRKVVETRCIYCHSNGFKIPFDDVTKLTALLKSDEGAALVQKVTARTDPKGPEYFRMPFQGSPLNSEERAALLAYLKALSDK